MADLTNEKLAQIIYNAYWRRVKDRPEYDGKLQPWLTLDGREKPMWHTIASEVQRDIEEVRKAER